METKDNGTKTKGTDFGCCNPENFKEMFEKMGKCCPGQGDYFDFSTMKGVMMKTMMERCCRPASTDTKRHADSQNK
jgi:hypothetical protein